MSIKVLLVDDDPLVRAGLRLMLRAAPDIEVVGEAHDGETAVAQAAGLSPDVILMDIRMPGTDGVTATAQIARFPDPGAAAMLQRCCLPPGAGADPGRREGLTGHM